MEATQSNNLYSGYKYSSYDEYYNTSKQKTNEKHKQNREQYNEYQREYQREYQQKVRDQKKLFQQLSNHPLFPNIQQIMNNPQLYQNFLNFVNIVNNPPLYQHFVNYINQVTNQQSSTV
jgi:ATP-dependent 26S proteasome regulatory subunit